MYQRGSTQLASWVDHRKELQKWLGPGKIVGKVGGVSKNKIQWRRVNFVGNRCIYSNPLTQKERALDLEGLKITPIDQTKKTWQKFDKMKFEAKHPEGTIFKKKCFIAVNTKKGKILVFMVELDNLNNWMSLFLQETFPPKKELLYNNNMTMSESGSLSKATGGKAKSKDAVIMPTHASSLYQKSAAIEVSGTGSGLERVNTLTTRLHRLPTIVEENKGASANQRKTASEKAVEIPSVSMQRESLVRKMSQRFPNMLPAQIPDVVIDDNFERIVLYEETSFLVTLADPQGNLLENITPVVTIKNHKGVNFPFTLDYNDDGSFSINFTPLEVGLYNIQILVDSQLIEEFVVMVDPAPAEAFMCVASGPGLVGSDINVEAVFSVALFDCRGSSPNKEGHLEVYFTEEGTKISNIQLSILKLEHAKYEVRYTPLVRSTQALCHVKVGPEEIKGSPFPMVFGSSELVSVVKVEGDGVVSAKVAKMSNFSVSTFNASGKPIDISKSDLDIIFGDQLGNEIVDIETEMTVENELHKVHVCYTSRTPGLMAIHVTVGGVPIKQSPFIVEVLDSIAPRHSKLRTNSEKLQYTVGVWGNFEIELRGELNEPLSRIDQLEAVAYDGKGKQMKSNEMQINITAKDKGFAVVNYLALPGKNISGDIMMGVFVSGKHISGSPFKLRSCGVDPSQCLISGDGLIKATQGQISSFMLTLMDSNGVPQTSGNVNCYFTDRFATKNNTVETKIVRDTQSASQYRISFQPAVAGVIVANVLVNDIDVCGSPYTIEVARVNNSKPASPKLSVLKRESSIIKVGVPALATLFLKDANGGMTNGTLPEIVFGDEIGNIVENIDIQLVKESDVGHFSVKYTPKDMIGKVAMHVTLDGELIAGAPFLFDIEKWQGPDPKHCQVVAPKEGLSANRIGCQKEFQVLCCDHLGEPVKQACDVKVSFTDRFGNALGPEAFDLTVVNASDCVDAWLIKYTPKIEKIGIIHVSVDGHEIAAIHIEVEKDYASAVCSSISKFPDIVSACSSSSFTVATLDRRGSPCAPKCEMKVAFLDATGNKLDIAHTIEPSKEDESQYVVNFTPQEKHIGEILCAVFIYNVAMQQTVKFSVVFPEPYLPLCRVNGIEPKVEGICYSMHIVDRNGRPCLNDVTVSLENISGKLEDRCIISAQVGENNNYLFFLDPNGVSGKCLCFVKFKEIDIAGSPFYVFFPKPKADLSRTQFIGPGIISYRANSTNSFNVNFFSAGGGQCESPAKLALTFLDENEQAVQVEWRAERQAETGNFKIYYTPPTDFFDDIYMSAYVGTVRLNNDTPFYLTDVLTSLYSAEGYVGSKSTFEMVLEDEFGTRYIDAVPEVQVSDATNNFYKFHLQNNGDGSFVVEFMPEEEGTYTVQVYLYENLIQEWSLRVSSNAVSPQHSVCDWNNTELICFQEYKLTITGRNSRSVNVPLLASQLGLTFTTLDNQVVDVVKYTINDKQSADGVLTITFKPLVEGVFKMTPTINGMSIPGAPINVCVSLRSLLSRMRQDVQIPTLYKPQQFFVDPREENLNPNGKLSVQFVENETQNPVDVKTTISKNRNGIFDVSFTPEAAGSYQMTVKVDDAVVGESFLLNFPPNKPSEKHSSLTLPTSMESVGVPVNTPCEFSARIADERNNPVISNQLRVVCEPATVTKLSVKKAGTNGEYQIQFVSPIKPGRLNMKFFLDQTEITHFEKNLLILAGAPHPVNCFIERQVPITVGVSEHSSFIVNLRDKHNNPITKKFGYVKAFYTEIQDPALARNRNASRTFSVTENSRLAKKSIGSGPNNNNGPVALPQSAVISVEPEGDQKLSVVKFSFPIAGEYKIHVTVEGSHIFGSPFHVTCRQLLTTAKKVKDMSFPRLIRVAGSGQAIQSSWEPLGFSSLNTEDLFIIDNFTNAYQWGLKPHVSLLNKALTLTRAIAESRNTPMQIKVVDDLWSFDADAKVFWALLGITQRHPDQKTLTEGSHGQGGDVQPVMYSIKMNVNKVPLFEKAGEGNALRASGVLLTTKSYLLDTGFDLHLWEGKRTEWRINESIIDAYVLKFTRPKNLKVTSHVEGRENSIFLHFVHT